MARPYERKYPENSGGFGSDTGNRQVENSKTRRPARTQQSLITISVSILCYRVIFQTAYSAVHSGSFTSVYLQPIDYLEAASVRRLTSTNMCGLLYMGLQSDTGGRHTRHLSHYVPVAHTRVCRAPCSGVLPLHLGKCTPLFVVHEETRQLTGSDSLVVYIIAQTNHQMSSKRTYF